MAQEIWDYSGEIPRKVNQVNPGETEFRTPGGATTQDIADVGYKSATSIMGAPVDLASMFLKPLGYSNESPVMGSNWMNQQAAQAGVISNPEMTGGDIAASMLIPDPLDIVKFTKYAAPIATGVLAGKEVMTQPTIEKSGNFLKELGGSIKSYFNKASTPPLPQSLNDAPAPYSLIKAASEGDKEAYDTLAKEVYGRTFEMIANKNTGDQLKPMLLDKLMENPNMVEDLASKFGYKVRYFSSNPENVGRKIGDTSVEERPATRSKLQKQGYAAGNIWVYDPYDTHGSFNDPEYTKAWRGIHELAHGITERVMEAKYGKSRRFGALGVDTKNPYDPNDPRTYKALTAEEAQRAIEWEDVAFRTQLKLLDELGIKVDKQQAVNDFNIAGSDTVLRTLTGDFSDPATYGVLPRKDDYRINVKSVLQLLQNQENEIAKSQGRTPTQGIDLKSWQQVSDNELDKIIKNEMQSPLKQPIKDSNLLMSIEAVPGETVDLTGKNIIQTLPYKDQENYLKDMHTALTDQAGSSLIAKKLGLDVGMGNYTTGVWKGETNPVLQLEIKPQLDDKGFLTNDFKSKLDDMAEMYAVALKQDGVGWNMAHYNSDNIKDQNAIEFVTDTILDPNTVKDISKDLSDFAAIVTTKNGVRFLNISDLPNNEFISKIENKLESLPTEGDIKYYTADSNFVQGVTNDKKQTNSISRRSDLQEWFNDHIIKQTERVNQRYQSKAEQLQTKSGNQTGNTKVNDFNQGDSMFTFHNGSENINIPTVINGKPVSLKEAIDHYYDNLK